MLAYPGVAVTAATILTSAAVVGAEGVGNSDSRLVATGHRQGKKEQNNSE